jgi:RNA polymerase sigma-70 factor (ECF subfamily)
MSLPAFGASAATAPQAMAPAPDELLGLARAAETGNGRAAATLIGALGGSMLRAVRKVLGANHPDVDDVTQDAVIALISALSGFRGDCTVAHFAVRVAVLTAMAARRRSQTRARFTAADAPLDELEDRLSAGPVESILAAKRRELVRQLLDELPDVIAEAVALHFMLGYTVEEIAAASSVPENTVWSRLRIGKQRLRGKLKDERFAEFVGGEP